MIIPTVEVGRFVRLSFAYVPNKAEMPITCSVGLSQGLLTTQQTNIDFSQIQTYWIYAGGLFAFNLFAFLAFSFAEIKSDSKKLNYFSLGGLFLLACHVGQQVIPSF